MLSFGRQNVSYTLGELFYSSKFRVYVFLLLSGKMFMVVEFCFLYSVLSFGPSMKPFCFGLCWIGHTRMESGSSRRYQAVFARSNMIYHLLLMKFFISEFGDGENYLLSGSFFPLCFCCYFFQLQLLCFSLAFLGLYSCRSFQVKFILNL